MPQRPTHLQLLRETLPTAYSGRFDAAAECCQKATLPLQALLQLFFLQFLRRQQQRQPGGWERVGELAPQQRCASTSRQTTARRAASSPKQHHYQKSARALTCADWRLTALSSLPLPHVALSACTSAIDSPAPTSSARKLPNRPVAGGTLCVGEGDGCGAAAVAESTLYRWWREVSGSG